MKNEVDVSVWTGQLEAAAAALAKCPDTPDWLKQMVVDALAVAAKIAQDVGREPVQDSLFFYPH